jgi:very-short-patch-repair endonuclease
MKETTLQRSRRQAHERKLFVSVLEATGEIVTPEARFHPKRKWKFDYAFVNHGIAVEIEGLNGRHQMTGGFIKDMEKYNEAAILGWRVFRFTTRQIADASALATLARAGVGVKNGR